MRGSLHFESCLFKVQSSKFEGLAPIRYADTRFGLYFVMLRRLLRLRPVLRTVVTCDAYVEKKYKDDEEYEIIMDSAFWDDVGLLVKMIWPLMMLLRLRDRLVLIGYAGTGMPLRYER